MLNTIISSIENALESAGTTTVYSAFDSLPMESRGKIYTVVSVESLESSAPIFSEYYIYLPFKAEAGVSIVSPMDTNMAKLYELFNSNILPVVRGMESLTCSLRNVTIKKDANINRLVLKSRFSISGISRIERSKA